MKTTPSGDPRRAESSLCDNNNNNMACFFRVFSLFQYIHLSSKSPVFLKTLGLITLFPSFAGEVPKIWNDSDAYRSAKRAPSKRETRNIATTSKFPGFRRNILFQHAKTGGIRGFRHLVVLKLYLRTAEYLF